MAEPGDQQTTVNPADTNPSPQATDKTPTTSKLEQETNWLEYLVLTYFDSIWIPATICSVIVATPVIIVSFTHNITS